MIIGVIEICVDQCARGKAECNWQNMIELFFSEQHPDTEANHAECYLEAEIKRKAEQEADQQHDQERVRFIFIAIVDQQCAEEK